MSSLNPLGVGGLFTLLFYLTIKQFLREMKKIDYQTPEMEVVEIKMNGNVLLNASYKEGPGFNENPGDGSDAA